MSDTTAQGQQALAAKAARIHGEFVDLVNEIVRIQRDLISSSETVYGKDDPVITSTMLAVELANELSSQPKKLSHLFATLVDLAARGQIEAAK
jgi:hypothetical protein